MSDERTIRELAAVARADAERTEELSARVEQPASAGSDDDEEAFLREVLAQGDDERLVEAALGAAKSTAAPATVPADARGVARTTKPVTSVTPLRTPSRTRWLPAAASALALAAGLFLFLRSRDGTEALPTYQAILSGADSVHRSTPEPGKVVSRGASLVLVAQPRESVKGALEARAFAGCGGALAKVETPITIASSGAARIQGTPESLFGPAAEGPCALALAIGRPGTLPDRAEDAAAKGSVLVRVDVVVRGQR